MNVRRATGTELTRAQQRIRDEWGDPIVVRGRDYAVGSLDYCLIAGDFDGVLAFTVDEKPVCELVAIIAATPWRGAGTALIEALRRELGDGFTQIRLMTTNDNVDALRFYQRRGFRLTGLRPGAVDVSRRHKPSIPLTGDYGIPVRDEIDLTLDL
jgi:GNAT superfamily N-acetyltransferase